MRSLRMVTILGAGMLALAFTVSALAAGSGNGGKTVELTAGGDVVREQVDLGAPGPSVGDMLVGRTDLFQDGKKVGFARFTCVFNAGTGVMCTNHNTLLGRGQIVSQQSGDPTEGPVVVEAITGGTGEFRNARGQVRVDFSNASGPRITMRLVG